MRMTLSKTDELIVEHSSTPQGVLVIRISGWLTLKNKQTFEHAIETAEGRSIVLDLAGLHYMDSAGLGALLKAYATAQKRGARLALAAVLPRVRDLLHLTKIEPLFEIYPDLESAIAGFAKNATASVNS